MKKIAILALLPTLLMAEDLVKNYTFTVSPTLQYQSFKNEACHGTCVAGGVDLKYLQDEGYNCFFSLAYANGAKYSPNIFMDFKHSYKFDVNGLKLYPIFSLNYNLVALYHHVYIYDLGKVGMSHGIEKASLGAGIGTELVFSTLKIQPEFEVTKEVSKMEVKRRRKDSLYWGNNISKDWGFKASILASMQLSENNSVELTPFYTGDYDGFVYNRGVKAAFVFNL